METITYKCPSCGADLEYDGKTGVLTCDYCGSSFEVDSEQLNDEIVDEEKREFADEWLEYKEDSGSGVWTEEERTEINAYTCPSCGAELVTDETTAAESCPYCGNNVAYTDRLSGEYKPDFVVPFKIKREEAEASLRKFYKKKLLAPSSFKNENKISEIKGVYVPFWLFSGEAEARVTYKAEIIRSWVSGKYRNTQTKHYRLEREGKLTFCDVPFDGSTKADDAYMEAIEPYDYSGAKPFSCAYLSGFLANKYDVDSAAGRTRIRERVSNSIKSMIRSEITGYTSIFEEKSDVKVSQTDVKYVLLPVWALNTNYRGKTFKFAMNGQTGKFVGEAPVSWTKFFIWLVSLSATFSLAAVFLYYLFG